MGHRAEFEDIKRPVVEALARLPEKDRTRAVQLHCDGRQNHQWPDKKQDACGQQQIFRPLQHGIGAGNRALEQGQDGQIAKQNQRPVAKGEIGKIRGQPNADRCHRNLGYQLLDAGLGRPWQCHNHLVDMSLADHSHQIVRCAEHRQIVHQQGYPTIPSIIEKTHQADRQLLVAANIVGQFLALSRSAVDRRPTVEHALPLQPPNP